MLDEKLLEETREAVEKYTPMLTERIGIDLPTLEVAPKDECGSHFRAPYGIAYFPVYYEEELVQGKLVASLRFKPRMYVSFGIKRELRKLPNDLIMRETKDRYVDSIVMHELANYAWDVIAGGIKEETPRAIKLAMRMGYADYIQKTLMADAYPPGARIARHRYLGQETGRAIIELFIAKYGKDSLAVIPKDWETFADVNRRDLEEIAAKQEGNALLVSTVTAVAASGAVLLGNYAAPEFSGVITPVACILAVMKILSSILRGGFNKQIYNELNKRANAAQQR